MTNYLKLTKANLSKMITNMIIKDEEKDKRYDALEKIFNDLVKKNKDLEMKLETIKNKFNDEETYCERCDNVGCGLCLN
jgi:hypothetical protein